jgi:hypothetical protein
MMGFDTIFPQATGGGSPPQRRITEGDWKDRFGLGLVTAIAVSSHPLCIGLREMLNNRAYVDLDRADLPVMLNLLVAQSLPAPVPGLPDSGPFTAEKVQQMLADPRPGEG